MENWEQRLERLAGAFDSLRSLLLLAAQQEEARDRNLTKWSVRQTDRDLALNKLSELQAISSQRIARIIEIRATLFTPILKTQAKLDEMVGRLAQQVEWSTEIHPDTQTLIEQFVNRIERTQELIEAIINSVTRLTEYSEQSMVEQAELRQTIAQLAEQLEADRQAMALERTESQHRWQQTQMQIRQIWQHLKQQTTEEMISGDREPDPLEINDAEDGQK